MSENDPRGNRLPPELARLFAGGDRKRRSQLCHIDSTRPLAELAVGEAQPIELSAGDGRALSGAIRRSGEMPPSFELTIKDLPADVSAECLVVGAFTLPAALPAATKFEVPVAFLPEHGGQVAESPAFQLAAATKDLDAADASKANQALKAKTADFQLEVSQVHRRVDVWADKQATLCRSVVVETQGPDDAGQEIVQRQLLNLGLTLADGRLKGAATFERRSFRAGGSVTVTARSVTARDLDLLDGDQVNEFLGAQDFLALPIDEVNGRLTCCARWPAQQRLVADPSTTWALQLAVPVVEARS